MHMRKKRLPRSLCFGNGFNTSGDKTEERVVKKRGISCGGSNERNQRIPSASNRIRRWNPRCGRRIFNAVEA